MTHLACPVSTCDKPRKGSENICGWCQADLRRALEAVPALAVELDTTLSRQTPRTGGGSERPLPYDVRASAASGQLRVTLVGWVRVLDDDAATADTLTTMATWLLERLQELISHKAAQEMCEEITTAVQAAERAVDRPGERTYAGPCKECREDLYAQLGATLVRCKGCGWECGVTERKEWLLEQLNDRLATASEIAHIVTTLDSPLSPALVRRWACPRSDDRPAKLLARGYDMRGRPLYLISDARALLGRKLVGKV